MTTARLRLPRTAYLAAAALAVCVTPMMQAPWLFSLYLLPILAVAYIARSGTDVDSSGITARALLGSATAPWPEVTGLRVGKRGQVYALLAGDRQLRLPNVRPKDVPVIMEVSNAESGAAPLVRSSVASAPAPESSPTTAAEAAQVASTPERAGA